MINKCHKYPSSDSWEGTGGYRVMMKPTGAILQGLIVKVPKIFEHFCIFSTAVSS
jgi:hypothetical protein